MKEIKYNCDSCKKRINFDFINEFEIEFNLNNQTDNSEIADYFHEHLEVDLCKVCSKEAKLTMQDLWKRFIREVNLKEFEND